MRRERFAPVLRGRGSIREVDQSSKSVAFAGKGVHLYYVGWELYAVDYSSKCVAFAGKGVHLYYVGWEVYAEWISVLNLLRAQGKACTCITWAGKCTRNGSEF
jgi:hypothetical protein